MKTNWRTQFAYALFAAIALMHLYALVRGEEFWPISPYAMFSTPHAKGQYPLLGYYAVIAEENEREVLLNYDPRFSIQNFSIFNQISPRISKLLLQRDVKPELRALLHWYNEISAPKASSLRLYSLRPAYDLDLADIHNLRKEKRIDEVFME